MSPSTVARLAQHSLTISTLALILVGAACGSSGGGSKTDGGGGGAGGGGGSDAGGGSDLGLPGSDAPIGATPAEQCNALVTTLCTRGGECLNTTPAQQSNCQTLLNVQFGCERATLPFTACVQDTRALSCSALFPMGSASPPASCDMPLEAIPVSQAQMQCVALVRALCTRSAECQNIMATPAQIDGCVEEAIFGMDGIPCPFVTGVSATYDMCVAQVRADPCITPPDGGAPDGGTPDGGAPADAGMPNGGRLPACNRVLITPTLM
jgi:hypothetical protein